MSGRSPSNSGGVASLRARFEENSKHESPPSRGRSPAGSVASDSSRPISKVRASFIAVEPMGDLSETKEAGKTEGSVTGDGTQDVKAAPEAGTGEGQGVNDALPDGKKDSGDLDLPKSTAAGVSLEKGDGSTAEAKDVNPDKPTSRAEDTTASLLPSDPKATQAVSSGDALAEDVADLGSILKGSSFETKAKPPADELKKDAIPQKSATSSHPQSAAKVSGPTKASAAPAGAANGRPKQPASKVSNPLPLTDKAEPPAPTPATASTSAPAAVSTSTTAPAEASTPAPAPASVPAEAPQEAPETAAPVTADIKGEKPEEPKPAPTEEVPSNVNTSTAKSAKAPAGPKTSTGATNTTKAAPSTTNASAPKSSNTAKSAAGNTKPGSKMPGPKPGNEPGSLRSSVSKEALVPPTKTNKPATKKVGPTSPTIPTKPRPKSPTRPVRLSSHLTAPTAASAAKLDHGAPAPSQQASRSPSRTSNLHPSKPIPSKTVSSLQQRTNRPPRASMPAAGVVSSKPLERPKARQSLAGGAKPSADTNSFLERMMRPTQSSAQKTHDKVEGAGKHSPPSKKSTVAGGSRSTSLNLDAKRKAPAADKTRAAPSGAVAGATGTASEAEEEHGAKEEEPQTTDSGAPVTGDIGSSAPPQPAESKAGENGVSADETADLVNGAEEPSLSTAAPTATAEKSLVPQPVVDAGETF